MYGLSFIRVLLFIRTSITGGHFGKQGCRQPLSVAVTKTLISFQTVHPARTQLCFGSECN